MHFLDVSLDDVGQNDPQNEGAVLDPRLWHLEETARHPQVFLVGVCQETEVGIARILVHGYYLREIVLLLEV